MLLTNFNKKDKEKYSKLLEVYKKRTGNKDIYIDNNAYVNGHKLEDHCALRCKFESYDNLNTFYRLQDELGFWKS